VQDALSQNWGFIEFSLIVPDFYTSNSSQGFEWQIHNNLGLGSGTVNLEFTLAPVPEPTSLAIFGIGAIGMVVRRRRKKKQTA